MLNTNFFIFIYSFQFSLFSVSGCKISSISSAYQVVQDDIKVIQKLKY